MDVQCRACLNSKDAAYVQMDSPITEGLDFFACFTLCTQLNAERHDGLPGILCTNCSQDLQVAYNFVQNAREADTFLRNTLQLPKIIPGEVQAFAGDDDGKVIEGETAVVNVKDVGSEDYIVEELENELNGGALMNLKDTVEAIEFENRDEEILVAHELNQLEFVDAKTNTANSAIKYEREDDVLEDESSSIPAYYAEDENDNEYLQEYDKAATHLQNNKHKAKSTKWKCIECKRLLRGDVSYEGHMNMHRSLRPYKCNNCLCAFRCRITLERHQQLRHQLTANTPKCDKCNKIFATDEELQEHHELVHPEYSHQLIQCDGNSSSKETAKDFPQSTTTTGVPLNAEPVDTTLWQCDVCKRYLYSEAALQLHRNTHTHLNEERPHECEFCKKRFAWINNLRTHIRSVHNAEYVKLMDNPGEELVKCETCKKPLLRKNLDKHMATHRKKEKASKDVQPAKFLCAYCSRECKNQKTLNQHEKMHRSDSPDIVYMCTECDRSYATQHLLQQHRKQAHKERDHICPICGNAFKLKNQLGNHMKLHLEKNIKCPHCEKCYARRFDLDVHMRTHTGELPFSCHICDKRFAIKVRLTYHLQKHYGIKHRCKECDAEFNSKQKLKAHTFKHTGMPYRCDRCDGHGFPNRDVFKRHLQRVHCSSMSDEELVAMFQRNTGKTTRICRVDYYNAQQADESKTVTVTGSESASIAETLIDAEDIELESEVVYS